MVQIYMPNFKDVVKQDEMSNDHYRVATALDKLIRSKFQSYYYVMTGRTCLQIFPHRFADTKSVDQVYFAISHMIHRQGSCIVPAICQDLKTNSIFIELVW